MAVIAAEAAVEQKATKQEVAAALATDAAQAAADAVKKQAAVDRELQYRRAATLHSSASVYPCSCVLLCSYTRDQG